MAAPFVNRSNYASLGGGTHSSLAISLTADNPDEVVLILVTFSLKAGSTPTVTSITGGGLTFTKLVGPATLSSIPIVPSGTGTIQCELWWAPATLAFTGTVFTVNFSSSVTSTSGDVGVQGATIIGCNNPASPWDGSVGLPASLTGAAPLTITFATNTALNPAVFTDGTTLGSVIYFGDGLVGTDGDELVIVFAIDSHTPSLLPTTGWSEEFSSGTTGAGAFPDFFLTLYSNSQSPPPPASQTVTTAELWFAPTASFVDLATQANRRLFVSQAGAAQNLGPDGSIPFQVTPPVFLSSDGADPETFALNNGRGGPFPLTEGGLENGATDPPGATESVTTYATGPTHWGVVGDYLTGNIYSWNPATLTDNGTRKVWRRTWRALPKASELPKRFGSLVIGIQTGSDIPDGTAPQVMLRWSDDNGATWSDQRIVPVGALGATSQIVKFNRLGMTRRFGGSDRLFELTSADYFAVAILDAEVDVA